MLRCLWHLHSLNISEIIVRSPQRISMRSDTRWRWLTGTVAGLLPAMLSLLRSKAREVIKAVLGMLKVTSC